MIEIGATLTVEKTVTPELTAQMAGSGMLPVFGTPFMTAMMENAAARSIRTVRMRSEDRIFLFKILEEPGTVSSVLITLFLLSEFCSGSC